MATAVKRYTIDDLDRFRDENPNFDYELLDGELLVSPMAALNHQRLCHRLVVYLDGYVMAKRLGELVGPGAVQVPPYDELHPDILVVAQQPWDTKWADLHDWWLAIEVLSPSTRAIDLGRKRRRYLELGVREVWLVDMEPRTVTVVRRDTPDLTFTSPATLTWRAPNAEAPLSIDLGELFAKD